MIQVNRKPSPGLYKAIVSLPEQMKRWLDEAAKTDTQDLTPLQIANLPPDTLTDSFGDIVKSTGVISPSGEFPY